MKFYREDLLIKAKFKVKITLDKDYTNEKDGIELEEIGLNLEEALSIVKRFVALRLSSSREMEFWEMMGDGFGYKKFGLGHFYFAITAYFDKIHLLDQKQTCPSRMDKNGKGEHIENIDYWIMIGEDKCCSYCRSIHPDRVIELIKMYGPKIIGSSKLSGDERTFIAGKKTGYKVSVINRPDVIAYEFGGVEFYSSHFNKEQIEIYNTLMHGYKRLDLVENGN